MRAGRVARSEARVLPEVKTGRGKWKECGRRISKGSPDPKVNAFQSYRQKVLSEVNTNRTGRGSRNCRGTVEHNKKLA